MYEYFCIACYEIFKCVFLESVFFKLVQATSQVLVNLKFGGDLQRMYLYRMNYGFQHLMFFLLFSFTSQNDEKYKKNRYFKFKMLFLIFEFSIFMIIKMHFDFPVSHNQVDHSSPFSKTYFTQCYIILTTFVNLVKKKNCKYYVSMNKSVCENSIPKCIMVSSQKNPEEDDVFMPKNRNIPSRSSTIFHCFFLLAQQCVNTQISSLSKPLSH